MWGQFYGGGGGRETCKQAALRAAEVGGPAGRQEARHSRGLLVTTWHEQEKFVTCSPQALACCARHKVPSRNGTLWPSMQRGCNSACRRCWYNFFEVSAGHWYAAACHAHYRMLKSTCVFLATSMR